MSKVKAVYNRTTNRAEELTAGQVRKIRKAERKSRLNGVMPDFRNHLPYDVDSINRIFFFLKPLKKEDLKTPFVGHYSAEQNVPNPALDGTPTIEATTTTMATAPVAGEVADAPAKPKKARKPAAKKTASKTTKAKKEAATVNA